MNTHTIIETIDAHKDPERAAFLQGFFKTGKGEYAEGDVFLGIVVPTLRKLAKEFRSASPTVAEDLLHSPIHEHRFVALLLLVRMFEKGDELQRKHIADVYLRNTKWINNWDLVDVSAHKILGPWLLDQSHELLFHLAESPLLWDRRIAVVTNYHFIRKAGNCETLLQIAELLLSDSEDLIHKAVGWMLREAGKVDLALLEMFLETHAAYMPRTMLRYAIERLEPSHRRFYLQRKARTE